MRQSDGFGLIELTMVIIIVGILVAVAMQSATVIVQDARRVKTEQEMEMLTKAIVGDPSILSNGRRADFGYVGDVGGFPPDLQALYENPGGYGTWAGPYLPPGLAQDSTGFKTDEWGSPYSYSGEVAITSTGSGSTLTKKIADAVTDYTLNSLNGTIRDADGAAPGVIYSDSVNIKVTIPDGAGGSTTKSYAPDAAGSFTLDSLPAGTHPLRLIYIPNADTLLRCVTILPRNKGTVSYKFASAYFSGGGGTVEYEEFTEGKRSSDGNSVTIPTPPGTNGGDLLVAAVVTDGNKASQLTPPGGEGWTELNISQQTGAVTLGVWWKLADAAESSSHQFTWGGNGQEAYGWIMRFNGQDPSAPINASAVDGGSSSAPDCPSVTTTVANTLIVRIGGFDNDAITVDNTGLSGHTSITMDASSSGSGNCSGGAGYKTQAAVGPAGTATFALTSAEQWRTMTIAIAPSP